MIPIYGTVLYCHGLEPQAPEVLARAYDAELVVVHASTSPRRLPVKSGSSWRTRGGANP